MHRFRNGCGWPKHRGDRPARCNALHHVFNMSHSLPNPKRRTLIDVAFRLKSGSLVLGMSFVDCDPKADKPSCELPPPVRLRKPRLAYRVDHVGGIGGVPVACEHGPTLNRDIGS